MSTRRSWLVLAVLAVVVAAAALAGTFPLQRGDVAASAPAAQRPAPTVQEGVLATYEAEYARERERLAALSSHALREEIVWLHREVSDVADDRRRHIDEEGAYDAGDVSLYDSALLDLRSSLDAAYYELDNRGEISSADEVAHIEVVDVAEDREDVEASRADRDRYVLEGRASSDHADELAILEADVDVSEAMLQASEARLRIAERDAAGF